MHPDTRKRIDVSFFRFGSVDRAGIRSSRKYCTMCIVALVQVMGILGVLNAVIRRCHVHDVAAEQLAAAGFLIDAPDGSKRLVRNPAFALFRLVSERFFQLATCATVLS